MKKRQILILPIIVMACLCFNSCSKKDDDNPEDMCGAKDTWYSQSLGHLTYDDLLIQDRYLYYEDNSTPVDICADNNITATFNFVTKKGLPLEGLTSIQGKLYWGLNEEKYITLKWDNQYYRYYATLGTSIKGFFGDAPGWVGLTLIFKFPTKGTLAEDRSFIENNFIDICHLEYNHF